DLRAGFRYVAKHRGIAALLTAKMGLGLTGASQTLTAIYGQRLFPLPGDPEGKLTLSLLVGTSGVGTALGPILGRRFTGPDRPRMRWAIAAAFLLRGLFYALMGASRSLGGAALALVLGRFGGSVIWVFSTVLLQMATEDQYRGRVFAAEASL